MSKRIAALYAFALAAIVAAVAMSCPDPNGGAVASLGLSRAPAHVADLYLSRVPRPPLGSSPPEVEAEPQAEPDPRVAWCEPLIQQPCRSAADCSNGDRCVRPWWAEAGADLRVCARPSPDLAERRWRGRRLRVVVDHVCTSRGGCNQTELHAYLRLLALRESTFRPWKRARLSPDLDASARAWARQRDRFAGNPAAGDPDRWSGGLGLYSQIPALWLPRWDSSAPPETLCGEVEATEAHLRAARDQVRKIANGIDCDGDGSADFFGSARLGGASWYDASRVNSGSPCPGSLEHQRRFAARAASVGLDPWASITERDLGRPIEREHQDAVAKELRRKMDVVASDP